MKSANKESDTTAFDCLVCGLICGAAIGFFIGMFIGSIIA